MPSIKRKDIVAKHYEIYGRHLQDHTLRQQILPALEAAGLVSQEPDPENKSRLLIHVTPPSRSLASEVRESGGGVKERVTEFIRGFKEKNGKKPTIAEVLASGATEDELEGLRKEGWIFEMPMGYLDIV